MSKLDAPHFRDDDAARKYLEAIRWPNGPVCPHCGVVGQAGELKGKSTRPGVWKCYACRKPFSVTVGTVFERSKIALHVWFQAVYFLCSSKKGMSSHQLHRTLGVTYKTAWFMTHRIREAMREGTFAPMGGGGKTVEADETYIGRTSKERTNQRGPAHKNKVFALVERGGTARTFHVEDVKADTLRDILVRHVDRKSDLMTDEAHWYTKTGKEFARHGTVNHRDEEYVSRDDPTVHTNTIEGFFSIFKRGMKGVYQHCSEDHLHRYLSEFEFRYNTRQGLGVSDAERATAAMARIGGKRLFYRSAANTN
jgi:transposase-like protein